MEMAEVQKLMIEMINSGKLDACCVCNASEVSGAIVGVIGKDGKEALVKYCQDCVKNVPPDSKIYAMSAFVPGGNQGRN